MSASSLAIFVIAIGLVYLWIKRRYSYWADRGFLQAHASFPFGSMKGAGTRLTVSHCLDKIYKEFKGKAPVVGFYKALTPQLLPLDTEMVQLILVKEFQSFRDHSFFHNKKDDPLSVNILTLNGEEWRERRLKFAPIFTSGKMKMMFEIVDSIGEKFAQAIAREFEKSNTLDMQRWSKRFMSDNIGNCAFGIDTNCLDDEDSISFKMALRISNLKPIEVLKFFLGMWNPRLGRLIKARFVPKEAADFYLSVFKQTFRDRLKNPVNRNDFVQMLLNLKDTYTETELAAEAFLVYAGGYETSSTLLMFTLYALALDQNIQDKLRSEILEGIEANGGKLTYDMLIGFKYLNMVVQETLRLYPPVPLLARTSTKEYRIPDTDLVIPKGTKIIINNFSLQRDPECFPDPETFNPERFNEENVESVDQFSHLPFGAGPRMCLGERFGLMQAKVSIVKLVQNFTFLPCEKTTIPMRFVAHTPFLGPAEGIWLNVQKYQK